MPKKRVFISFDYDNDSFLKDALVGQARNDDSPFEIADHSIKEAIPHNWEQKAATKISGVDVIVVICGTRTPWATGVATELAIAQRLGKPYFLLRGYSDRQCLAPTTAKYTDKIYDWTWQNLDLLLKGHR